MVDTMENSQIEEFITNLKGRKAYEEKKAIKLGFPNFEDYVIDKLSNELSSFNETLMDKPKLVVRTKRDTMDKAKNLENWKNFSEEYIDISSVSNTGLDILKDRLVSFLSSS